MNHEQLLEKINAIKECLSQFRLYQPAEFTEDRAAAIAKIADKYGFTDTRYALFHRQRILTAAEYRSLIGTYSDHIAIVESVREPFHDAIEEAVNRYGGSITIDDTIDLQLARKP